jgi:hypothetical protein
LIDVRGRYIGELAKFDAVLPGDHFGSSRESSRAYGDGACGTDTSLLGYELFDPRNVLLRPSLSALNRDQDARRPDLRSHTGIYLPQAACDVAAYAIRGGHLQPERTGIGLDSSHKLLELLPTRCRVSS